MKNLLFLTSLAVFFLLYCASCNKTSNIVVQNQTDSVAIFHAFFNDDRIKEIMGGDLPQLKIVKTKILNTNLKIVLNDKPVIFSDIDSSDYKFFVGIPKVRFFLNIQEFKFLNATSFKGDFLFRMSGYNFLFNEIKENGKWKVTKLEFHQI
jgi:hypothetical protein